LFSAAKRQGTVENGDLKRVFVEKLAQQLMVVQTIDDVLSEPFI